MRTLGYDPGGKPVKGKNRNGVACATFETNGTLVSVDTNTVTDAETALGWLEKNSDSADAIAIDTMLAWTFGDRPLDAALRTRYKLKNVLSAGSLHGSMLVNGVLVAQGFRSRMKLIEIHPKAALCVAPGDIRKKYDETLHKNSEHAADAFLGAWIAAQWLAGGWEVDLFEMLPPEPKTHYPAGEAVYPWPEILT